MAARPASPAVLLAVALAGAAGAQQAGPAAAPAIPGYDAALLDTCLALRRPVEDRSGCIGLAAADCLGEGPVIAPERAADCRAREAGQWAARLEAALVLLREDAARSDAAEAAGVGRAAALESAHTAWIAWREAECGWRQALAGGGETAALDCGLRETALRALALERLRAEGEGP